MYCRYCGKKKVEKETGLYNERTGKPEIKEICPDGHEDMSDRLIDAMQRFKEMDKVDLNVTTRPD